MLAKFKNINFKTLFISNIIISLLSKIRDPKAYCELWTLFKINLVMNGFTCSMLTYFGLKILSFWIITVGFQRNEKNQPLILIVRVWLDYQNDFSCPMGLITSKGLETSSMTRTNALKLSVSQWYFANCSESFEINIHNIV